jgi:hypothetical protein
MGKIKNFFDWLYKSYFKSKKRIAIIIISTLLLQFGTFMMLALDESKYNIYSYILNIICVASLSIIIIQHYFNSSKKRRFFLHLILIMPIYIIGLTSSYGIYDYLVGYTDIRYYDNGNLYLVAPKKYNEYHGMRRVYYENGKIKSEGQIIYGVRNGILKLYNQDGSLKEEITYKMGEIQ